MFLMFTWVSEHSKSCLRNEVQVDNLTFIVFKITSDKSLSSPLCYYSGCLIGRKGNYKKEMSVSWQLHYQRMVEFSPKCLGLFYIFFPLLFQTFSVELSSSRTLRCPQYARPSKYRGMDNSFWQQVKSQWSYRKPMVGWFFLCVLSQKRWSISIFISGTYKPTVRCYDTYQLSLKFERCMDSDGKWVNSPFFIFLPHVFRQNFTKKKFLPLKVVTFEILSDDYSKVRYFILLLLIHKRLLGMHACIQFDYFLIKSCCHPQAENAQKIETNKVLG